MRLFLAALALVGATSAWTWADDELPAATGEADAGKLEEKASYGLGFDIGSNIGESLRKQTIPINLVALINGFRDAIEGKKPAFPEDELRNAMNEHRRAVMTKMAMKNKEEGEAFLKANASKEGVKTTKSGLQYVVLQSGDGARPGPTDRVTTHYHGTLIDGTVFDSTQGGDPATFAVNEVIAGWTEALQLMKVGDKWRLFVPAKLAYGVNGAGPIGPNSVLVFEVELLDVQAGELDPDKAPIREP